MEKEKLSKLAIRAIKMVTDEFVGSGGEVLREKMNIFNVSLLANCIVRMVVCAIENNQNGKRTKTGKENK